MQKNGKRYISITTKPTSTAYDRLSESGSFESVAEIIDAGRTDIYEVDGTYTVFARMVIGLTSYGYRERSRLFSE